MSRIRSKNTSLELMVFSYLRHSGIYFQKHYKRIDGSPDLAIPSKKKAVFIDGDFWHGWRFSKEKNRLPSTYWLEKIGANIKRDKRNRGLLKKKGWSVLRIWEHDLKKEKEVALEKIKKFLVS